MRTTRSPALPRRLRLHLRHTTPLLQPIPLRSRQHPPLRSSKYPSVPKQKGDPNRVSLLLCHHSLTAHLLRCAGCGNFCGLLGGALRFPAATTLQFARFSYHLFQNYMIQNGLFGFSQFRPAPLLVDAKNVQNQRFPQMEMNGGLQGFGLECVTVLFLRAILNSTTTLRQS